MNNSRLHQYASVVWFSVLVLVALGSLVTTENAALAIPDWPLAFGQILPTHLHSSNVALVLAHRMLAAATLALAAGLAAWVFRSGCGSQIKRLGVLAFVLLFAQAVFGGVMVLWRDPNWLGSVHAVLGQICLLPVAAIAFATSRQGRTTPEPVRDFGWPSLRSIALWTPPLVFAQIALGALYRHHILGLIPHLAGALGVAVTVLLFSLFTLTQFPKQEQLRGLATALLLTIFAQILLGVATYISGSALTESAVVPAWAALVIAAHVAGGGVLLVFSCLLAVQVRRSVLPRIASETGVQAVS